MLQNELEDVEETIQDTQNLSRTQKPPSVYRDRHGRRLTFKPPTLHIGPSESTALPFEMLTRVKHPLKNLFHNVCKGIGDDHFQKHKLKAYKDNPCRIAKKRADITLHNLLDTTGNYIFELFIESLLERPVQFIRSLEAKIPALIQSNEDLIIQMSICRVNAVESHLIYEHMMADIENLRHQLMEYGHGHLFIDDFFGEEITLLEHLENSGRKLLVSNIIRESSTIDGRNKSQSFYGLWTVLQNGFVMKDGKEKKVSVKIYLLSARLEHTFPEVAKLRCLQDPNIGEFLGIYHSDSTIPTLVYQNHVKSLRLFIRSGSSDVRENLPRIVLDITSGLEYLHRNRMVHMEMSIDTVTVTYEGLVSLTGGCLPRRAAFPIDKESIEVGDFVYLAPEVLHSELYMTCADIYALALLLFELFIDVPFKRERKWRLDSFTAKVNPVEMLDLDSYSDIFGENMTYFFTQCLDPNPNNRPKTDMFLQNLKAQKHEIEVLSKTSLERKSSYCPNQSKGYRS
ncbi:hypothetical protein KUTeg_020734 [Tegillarca granosa]|uniref:Protein kinase domain-containing protein n=1 Tax=Tegillarca granosa TaxID=220873 RepID=A0ABQ9E8W4_TEGGR|nr:hypothetical protein KUTeg_020734 [Tegillarca granosa]